MTDWIILISQKYYWLRAFGALSLCVFMLEIGQSQNNNIINPPISVRVDSDMPKISLANDIKPETPSKDLHKLETEPKNEKVKATNLIERFFEDADYRNISIGSINATLHALATITSFGSHEGGPSWIKPINKLVDKAAFTCTRWIAPFVSYGFAAYKAFKNNEGIKCLIKLIPPVFLPMVGDANIDTVYGGSVGLNQPYDLVEERIKFLIEKHSELDAAIKEANKTFSGNAKLIWGVFKQMCKEFMQGRMPKEEAWYFINCIMILSGSIPMIMFARNARNTPLAKVLGLIRNLGGILGDACFFWFDRGNKHKFMIGSMCTVSAFGSIIKRWVKSDVLARTLIHLCAAMDVSAYALWNAYNDKSQEKKSKYVNEDVIKSKLVQLTDTKNIIAALAKPMAV